MKAPASGPVKRISTDPVRGGRLRVAYLGRRILAWRTGLYVLKESSPRRPEGRNHMF